MENRIVVNGTIIKGKDLKGYTLCKVISEDMVMRGFQYKIGMNVDVKPLALKGSCNSGLHFATMQGICEFLDFGTKLAIVSVPEDEDVYVGNGKFRTHRLEIMEVMSLKDVATWRFLLKNEASIIADDKQAVGWAASEGHLEVVKYLHENGFDTTASNNYAVCCAAEEGHLEVVKYLVENGADITAYSNCAVRNASENGHLEVVKYLHAKGADITACNNYAVRWAAMSGHLEVVKYLCENGADITACNNNVLKWAVADGHLDVIDYLIKNGATLIA